MMPWRSATRAMVVLSPPVCVRGMCVVCGGCVRCWRVGGRKWGMKFATIGERAGLRLCEMM